MTASVDKGWLVLPLAVILVMAACSKAPSQPAESSPTADFLSRHWPEHLPLQGAPPAGYTPLEASLEPAACGSCHVQQYQDWQTSLHSRSMGPGVLGQLLDMDDSEPETADMCRDCHAPLAEQQRLRHDLPGLPRNTFYDAALARQGLVCAGCHVRGHRRYGPPRVDRPAERGRVNGEGAHGGFTVSAAFTDSAFCSRCHQFRQGDRAVNGKFIENTYQEWRDSPYAAQGVQCQDCHMPGRRHLWRGIHDADMVRGAVSVTFAVPAREYRQGEVLTAEVTLANHGVGHYFPTYVTPRVVVRAYLLDAHGERLEGTLQEAVIGRALSRDLEEERYDTRIAPGESATITYRQPVPAGAARIKMEVVVEPDYFYERFFQSLTARGGGKGRQLLLEALENTRRSAFVLSEKTQALKVSAAHGQAGRGPSVPGPAAHRNSGRPAWNAARIRWHDYETGRALARATGRPMLVVFYADWCPTCHAYRYIFAGEEIVAAARALVMVRVNVDEEPALARRYAIDGEYVPRIFVVDSRGRIVKGLPERRGYPRFFLPAEDRKPFLRLMEAAAREAGAPRT